MNHKNSKRVKMLLKKPNPLFVQWLEEWRETEPNGSKMYNCYSVALKSLKQYPLPLNSGKDCLILHGFGTYLCNKIDEKLKLDKNEEICAVKKQTSELNQSVYEVKDTSKKKRKSVEYMPQYRSGAYAILLALYEEKMRADSVGFLTKVDLIKNARSMCDRSFTKLDPGTHYTAWSSMRTLISKLLVVKVSNPAKYSLTNEGFVLAEKLFFQTENNKNKTQSQPCSSSLVQHSKNIEKSLNIHPSFDCRILPPESFELLLIVDHNENNAANKQLINDSVTSELDILMNGYELRHLSIGDYTWICRDKDSKTELVVPYIIERKRMDDLAASIKDGRFHEQKFRLKKCGIPNIIYLVENFGNNKLAGLPENSLYQAVVNTLVQDEFTVVVTNTLRETAEYLFLLTKRIQKLFENKTLISCLKENLPDYDVHDDICSVMSFEEFNKDSVKNKASTTVQTLFIKQLLQIKGISLEKAIAIVEKYGTPFDLKSEYDSTPEFLRENMLSNISAEDAKQSLGPKLSSVISKFFTSDVYY